jgi:hypothetical protein
VDRGGVTLESSGASCGMIICTAGQLRYLAKPCAPSGLLHAKCGRAGLSEGSTREPPPRDLEAHSTLRRTAWRTMTRHRSREQYGEIMTAHATLHPVRTTEPPVQRVRPDASCVSQAFTEFSPSRLP